MIRIGSAYLKPLKRQVIMKSVFLILGVTLNVFFSMQAQILSNEMIIDPNSPSNNIVDISDTIVLCNVYKLDLDYNDSVDFTFTSQCSWGGMGGTSSITIQASDGSAFALDSTAIEEFGHFDSTWNPVYSPVVCMEVKIFNLSDTIQLEDCQSTNTHYISKRNYGNYPVSINYNSWDNWISGIHFIGIRKEINNIIYLGWIKVDVSGFYKIEILEYALNSPILGSEENTSFQFYPNPGTDEIFIDFEFNPKVEIEVYDLTGALIFQKKATENHSVIDVKDWSSGPYFFHLNDSGKIIHKKFIKL